MRLPSIPTFIRTLYAFSNTTLQNFTPLYRRNIYHTRPRATLSHSMPTIPFFGALFGSSAKMSGSESQNFPVQKTEGEWQAVLSPEQFRILRKKGTEMAGTGKYDKHYPNAGVYTCIGCSAPLYKASHKFDSGCGWPAFWDAVPGAVSQRDDSSFGMTRTEIVCNNCGGHLGHIFKGERFGNPKDERHCVNSVSINFSSEENPVKKD